MPNNYVIRQASSHDRVQAARIYAESLRSALWLPESSRVHLDFVSDTEGEAVCVAVDAAQVVVGFVSVWVADAFIHHLYVDAKHQRCGVGSALIHSLNNWLPRPWTLKCVCANRDAVAFYQSLGWNSVRVEEGPDGPYSVMQLI